jgi:perosamine synthetase
MQVPFFRPELTAAEIESVVDCLRSGWLTTGPRVRQFESQFAAAVGSKHAIALNSCTAALHLAVEALGLTAGQVVLVPTMTFAATAEVVRYQGALPLLVDCEASTGHVSLDDAQQKLRDLRAGRFEPHFRRDAQVVGMIPVHVAGEMMDVDAVRRFAEEHGLWLVEDAAHAFPAAWRSSTQSPWQRCGEGTADVTCYSFYANKTITTGEGGMAVTDDERLAQRMRSMSLHGLSRDAWNRYSGGSWDYRILAPGYKYNLTDVAAALGLVQLSRAEELRRAREAIARQYTESLSDVEELEVPTALPNRIHAWHLFPIRLRLSRLTIDRNEFIAELNRLGVGTSVHWRPLHLHPYYQETFAWPETDLPVASREWERRISLPLFPALREEEVAHVIDCVRNVCNQHRRSTEAAVGVSLATEVGQ